MQQRFLTENFLSYNYYINLSVISVIKNEIFYTNNITSNYETTIIEVINILKTQKNEKWSEKALDSLKEPLDEAQEKDYKDSIKEIHKAIKSLEKLCGWTICYMAMHMVIFLFKEDIIIIK